ncbi:MAG TPA: hypothetical protein VFG52_03305, partial [Xanthomonadales bacterium]|nr:hypothetical protein [Xanthomonadales bacterium]
MKNPAVIHTWIAVPLLAACFASVVGAQPATSAATVAAEPGAALALAPQRAPYHFETKSQARINGEKVSYRAVVEETFIENPAGERTASIVTTSYFREGVKNPTERPVLFVFNGGPGSAGLWLQMGLMGPRRVDFKDDVNPPTVPPYQLTDNAESPLDVADVVIFDP